MEKHFRKIKKHLSVLLAMSIVFAQMVGIPFAVMAAEGGETVVFEESFAGINKSSAKEGAIPEGWDHIPFNKPYTNAIRMDKNENSLTTEEFELPSEGTLTFDVISNNSGGVDINESIITIEAQIANQWTSEWTTAESIKLDMASGATDTKTVKINKEATRIRFVYTKNGGNAGLSNIKLTYGGKEEPAEQVVPGEAKDIIYETFGNYAVDNPAKNKVTLPLGWEPQVVGIYKTMGYEGGIGLKFTHDPKEKQLITPEFTPLTEEGELSFWLGTNITGDGAANTASTLTVSTLVNGQWEALETPTEIMDDGTKMVDSAITGMTTTGGFIKFKLKAGTTRVKFDYVKDGANLRLDELKITGIGELADVTPTLLTGLTLPKLEKMVIAEEKTINVTYLPADTTQKGVAWFTSNKDVVSVTDGKIVAEGSGTATITATSTENPDIKATTEVTVAKKVVAAGTVLEGQMINKKLPAGWETSEPADFYSGAPALKMTGWYDLTSPEFKLLSDGEISFYVKSNNARSGGTTGDLLTNTSKIVVEQLLPSGWGEAKTIQLKMDNGTFETFTAPLDSAARAVRISYVKEGGNIGIDNFLITHDEKATKIPVEKIILGDIEVGTEETKPMITTYEPANTTQKWLTWTITDPTIATVDQYGKVIGHKKGTTEITATSEKNANIKGSATVTVIDTKAPTLAKASPKGSGASKDATISIILEDDTGVDKESITITLDGEDVTKLFKGEIRKGTEEGILSYELSYKPAAGFEEKSYTIKVTAKDIEEYEMSEEWTFTVGVYEMGNLYFGNLHSHTNISDGTGTLEDAYTWARDKGKADYIAITDHSNWFDNDKEGRINDGSASSKWTEALKVSDEFTNDTFAAMYGYEMTWSNGTGHINTYNTKGFETRSNGDIDLEEYYARIQTAPESISQFNHPGTTFGDFKDFGFYSKEADELITMIEVGNGEGPVRGSGYFPSYEYYTRALDKGWHVSPTNNQDNHKQGWITANTARTVIEAPELTKNSLYDALRQRRTYATEDEDLRLSFTVNGQAMGSLLDSPEELNLAISAMDPNGDKVSEIAIIADGGAVVEKKSFNESDVEWNLTLEPEYSYYYVRVEMGNGDIAVTAPVWAGETIPVGLTSVEASSEVLEVGEEFELTTKAFNNTDYPLSNLKIEYFQGTLDAANKIGEATMVNLNAAGVAEVKTKVKIEDVGEHNIYASTTFTIKGAAKTSVVSTKIKVQNPEDMLKVLVDGGHFNDYVSAYYKDGMDGLDKVLANKEIKMSIHSEKDETGNYLALPMTDKDLENISLLILTTPESDTRNERNPYSDEDIAAIARFAGKGGSIIMTTRGDRSNANVDEIEFRNAEVGNKVLEALGSNMRMNNTLVVDDVISENVTYRLKFNNYRKDEYGLTQGITSEDEYNFYNGSSISLKEGADASKVTFPIAVHGSTGTFSTNNRGDYADNEKMLPAEGTAGNTEILGAEILPGGGKLIVSGNTFFSSFELKEDNINGNYKFTENVIDWMVQRPEAELVTIAQIHEGYPENAGKRYAIEGIVTAQSEAIQPKNAFFEVIYIQDETGGLTIFGVSQTELVEGQKVRLTGNVGEYEYDRQLRLADETKDLEILDSSINLVAPKVMTTQESMKDHNMGLLVNVTGKVTRMDDMNLWVDDGSGEARAYVNGYIWDGNNPDMKGKWDPTIKVGDTVTVTGLAAIDPDGPRLRIRNTGEITKVTDPEPETPEPETPEPETPEPETPEPETPEPETPEPETPEPETPGGGGGGSSKPKPETPKPEKPVRPHGDAPAETRSDGKGEVTIGTNNIAVETKGGTVRATVEKASTIKAIEQAAKEAIKTGEPNVRPTIVISLPFVKDKNMDVVISADIIKSIKENKVDIVIGSKEIEYTIPSGALKSTDLKDDETIEFSSKKVVNPVVKGKEKNDTVLKVLDFNLFVTSATESRKISQFDESIEIKISIEGLGDPNRLGIYYVDEVAGTLELISNKVVGGFIIMNTTHYSQYAIIEKGIKEITVSFSDIIGHWAQSGIESIVSKGIAGGYPDGTFKPNNSITRAEFVAMMNSYLGLDSVTYEGQFTDVQSNDWFANTIATAAANGLVGGYENGTFNPNGKITRAEMMSIISKTVKDVTVSAAEIETILASFTDKNDIANWAKKSTAISVKAGLIGGIDSKIEGKAQTTRAEAATVIDRMMNKK